MKTNVVTFFIKTIAVGQITPAEDNTTVKLIVSNTSRKERQGRSRLCPVFTVFC